MATKSFTNKQSFNKKGAINLLSALNTIDKKGSTKINISRNVRYYENKDIDSVRSYFGKESSKWD